MSEQQVYKETVTAASSEGIKSLPVSVPALVLAKKKKKQGDNGTDSEEEEDNRRDGNVTPQPPVTAVPPVVPLAPPTTTSAVQGTPHVPHPPASRTRSRSPHHRRKARRVVARACATHLPTTKADKVDGGEQHTSKDKTEDGSSKEKTEDGSMSSAPRRASSLRSVEVKFNVNYTTGQVAITAKNDGNRTATMEPVMTKIGKILKDLQVTTQHQQLALQTASYHHQLVLRLVQLLAQRPMVGGGDGHQQHQMAAPSQARCCLHHCHAAATVEAGPSLDSDSKAQTRSQLPPTLVQDALLGMMAVGAPPRQQQQSASSEESSSPLPASTPSMPLSFADNPPSFVNNA